MIAVEDIAKNFDSIPAVRSVSFALEPGQLTVLAGPDGAGKSTLFKIILGLLDKDSGRILLQGKDIGHRFSRITEITGYMPERFSLYPDLTVEENMNFFADIERVKRRRREELKHRLLERTGMLPFRGRRAGALSGGMKQKLALSTILLASPAVIILDESTTGVDPLSRIEFMQIIDDLKKEGKTILMSTPYLNEAEKGDRILFMKEGRIIKRGTLQEMRDSFPARLFRIRPEGHIIEVMQKLQEMEDIRDFVYMRGPFIKFLSTGGKDLMSRIPARDVTEEQPGLEDIYLYYERSSHAAGN
jgi:ABC-2 type transport system ATP-binding protein